jgi:hypothetical protein
MFKDDRYKLPITNHLARRASGELLGLGLGRLLDLR